MPVPEYLIGDPEYIYPKHEDMVKVELSTLITSRDLPELPIDFIRTMPLKYWSNLVWMGGPYPQYEVMGFEWWPNNLRDQPLNEFQRYGQEHRIADPVTKTVDTWYDIEDWTPEEIETEILRRIEVFKGQIKSWVRPALDAFVQQRAYFDLNDCISYLNSIEPSILAEATRARDLRDSYRIAMFAIIKDVEDRIIPIPKEEDIPNLDWPELVWEVIVPEPPVENPDTETPTDPTPEEPNNGN